MSRPWLRSAAPIALILLTFPVMARAQTAPAGCWVGTVASGGDQRRAVLELSRRGSDWTGKIIFLVRDTDPNSIAELSVSGDSISFRIVDVPDNPRFEGKVANGVFSGTGHGGGTHPFSFTWIADTAGTASPLVGDWFGWLSQNGAGIMRIGLGVVRAPCGQLLVTMDSPDQGASKLPVTALSAQADSLRFEMAYLGGDFLGGMEGDSLIGRWTQGGASMDLRLGRRDSTTSTRRPQEPVPPFPYTEESVTYQNVSDGTRIAGTLTLPPGTGPFPAALLITGSGAQDRNESVMGHKPFLIIADYLTRRGIAVLRVDDRGVGGSSGNILTATIADNAGDALAGINFLKMHAKIDPTRLGLIGHSEGGWVAPLAAAGSKDIAFVVLLAGAAVTGEAIIYAQDSLLKIAGGASPERVAAGYRMSFAIHQALKAEPNDSLAVLGMVRAVDSVYQSLPPGMRAALDSTEMGRDTLALHRNLQILANKWYRYLLTFDPVPSLRAVQAPVLALYGEKDLQVPPEQSVPVMEHALENNRDATVRVFPGLNHLFQHAETGVVAEYARIEETFAPEVLAVIGDWIVERFGKR